MVNAELYLSEAWLEARGEAAIAAATPWPVLITGPRGSGKSVLARFIHQESARAGSFVEAPAPTLAESLLHSEIRGHARGAFTDARSDHRGVLEQAHGGTLFFDEIEAASPALQALLVSLVENPQVTRIGEERSRRIDVRFVYASNADLDALVAERRFRADLLDRLRCHEIRVPALREYGKALLVVASGFLAGALVTVGADLVPSFAIEAVQRLYQYDWPGNLRELHTTCCHIAAHLQSPLVRLDDLPRRLRELPARAPSADANRELRRQVEEALEATQGNKAAAARMLDLPRTSFLRMVARVRRTSQAEGLSRGA